MMASLLALLSAVLLALHATEGRQGWKTYGNGYFIYQTKTDFHKTGQLDINGVFSGAPGGPNVKRTFLAVYDANDAFTFQLMVQNGFLFAAYSLPVAAEEISWSAPQINSGYAFSFNLRVRSVGLNASGSAYTINITNAGTNVPSLVSVPFGKKWNYTNVKIKVGGNGPLDPVAGKFFNGCLSNFTLKGVDIINEYFRQYPNNTNPIRGKEVFIKDGHAFSNVSQNCNDVMTTVGPKTTGASTWSSKVPTTTDASTRGSKASPTPQTKIPTSRPLGDAIALRATSIPLFLCISLVPLLFGNIVGQLH